MLWTSNNNVNCTFRLYIAKSSDINIRGLVSVIVLAALFEKLKEQYIIQNEWLGIKSLKIKTTRNRFIWKSHYCFLCCY